MDGNGLALNQTSVEFGDEDRRFSWRLRYATIRNRKVTELNALLRAERRLSFEFEVSYFMGLEQRDDQTNECLRQAATSSWSDLPPLGRAIKPK